MWLVFAWACGYTCGAGTEVVDGACVPTDAPVDTDGAGTDTDGPGPDTDADTDASGGDDDVDPVAGTSTSAPAYTGTCAPPDAWTGPIPASLYRYGDFNPDYDANMAAALRRVPPGGGSGSFPNHVLVLDATVVASDPSRNVFYVADGTATLMVSSQYEPVTVAPGDRVSLSIGGYTQVGYTQAASQGSTVFVEDTGSPVAVPDLGAAHATWSDDTRSQFFHVFGEVDRVSSKDCGRDFTCFVLTHDGVDDLIRLPYTNDAGLDVDYVGGLCAELIAPMAQHWQGEGVPEFLDANQASFIRTWNAP